MKSRIEIAMFISFLVGVIVIGLYAIYQINTIDYLNFTQQFIK